MRLDRDAFVITFRPESISVDGLIDIVKSTGYSARLIADSAAQDTDDSSTSPAASDDPLWVEALEKARKTNRPLVIDFHAAWCAPCRQMLAKTIPDASVAPLLEQTVFLKVDTDEHPDLAKAFSVAGLPDIRILTPEGQPLRTLTGFQDAASFSAVLKEVLAEVNESTSESN